MSKELFKTLSQLNVNENTEKKNKMTYLSWAFAWEAFSNNTDDSTYRIHMFEDAMGNQLPYMYDEKTGYMVMTSITVDTETKTMWLPVMDYKNNAKMDATMTDINKTLMRCLVKNMAMFGLGLYLYAGEDLPSDSKPVAPTVTRVKESAKVAATRDTPVNATDPVNMIEKVVLRTEADFTKAINEAKTVEELNELYGYWKLFDISQKPAYKRLLALTTEVKGKIGE